MQKERIRSCLHCSKNSFVGAAFFVTEYITLEIPKYRHDNVNNYDILYFTRSINIF